LLFLKNYVVSHKNKVYFVIIFPIYETMVEVKSLNKEK